MRNTTYGIAFGLLGASIPTLSPAQYQMVGGEIPGTTSTNCVLTTDGGLITTHPEGDGIVLRKYDASGEVLWNRILEDADPDPQAPYGTPGNLCRDNAGGAFLALGLRTTIAELNTNDPDTARYHILICHVHSDGTADMRVLERSSVWSDLSLGIGWPHNFLVASQGGEDVLVAISYNNAMQWSATEMVRFNSAMEPVWARCVGYASTPWYPFPVSDQYVGDGDRRLSFTSNGQPLFSRSWGSGTSPLDIWKLTPSGDLDWARTYDYTNTAWYVKFSDVAVDANDRFHAVGNVQMPSGHFALMPIIDPDGQLHRTSMYRTNAFMDRARIGLTSDGRRLVRSDGNTMICDTLGSHAPIKQARTIPFGEQNVHCEWRSSDLYNDMYCASGKVVEQHRITSYTTNYQSVVSMGVDQLGTCFHFDTSAVHYDVPEPVMTQEDMAALSLDVLPAYTLLPGDGIVITDLDPPVTLDLCSLVIGIADGPSVAGTPLVRNSLAVAGTPLSLIQPINGRIEVLDMSGRMVRNVPINGSTDNLSTSGWSAGVHLLRAINAGGQVMGTQRVVIE